MKTSRVTRYKIHASSTPITHGQQRPWTVCPRRLISFWRSSARSRHGSMQKRKRVGFRLTTSLNSVGSSCAFRPRAKRTSGLGFRTTTQASPARWSRYSVMRRPRLSFWLSACGFAAAWWTTHHPSKMPSRRLRWRTAKLAQKRTMRKPSCSRRMPLSRWPWPTKTWRRRAA